MEGYSQTIKTIEQALAIAVDSLNILRSKDYKVRIYELDDQLNQLVTFLEVSKAKYIKENKNVES